jgi:hypothetical protein
MADSANAKLWNSSHRRTSTVYAGNTGLPLSRLQSRYAMTMSKAEALYDRDFFEWTQENARLLEEGRLADADLAHIAEELEDMGKRDQRAVENRLEVLIRHLLKWQIQPEKRSASWEVSIGTQRSRLNRIFQQSPSLERHGRKRLGEIYCAASKLAIKETRLPTERFPAACPYTFEQIIDEEFLPE